MKEVPGFFTTATIPKVSESTLRSALEVGADAPARPTPPHESPTDFDCSQIKVLKQPAAPRYPAEAMKRRLAANMVMEIVVDPQGIPISCRPTPGPSLAFFTPVAAAYGMRWRFKPAMHNGVPQYARFRMTMPFRLR